MTKKPNIWITPHGDDWAVKREGVKRSIVITDTKQEAEKIGHALGKKDRVEVITQRADGRIQSKDSYGNDPCPPKDKEH
jgi:ferredoxin-thioredoxin reductase catalytic subunit